MATSVREPSVFSKTFFKTAGVLAAFIAVVASLALVAFLIMWVHDAVVSRQYDKHPQMGKDISWGPFLVSLDSYKNEKQAPVPAHNEPCLYLRGGAIAFPDGCNGQATVYQAADPGKGDIEATLRIKNRLWLGSRKVPADMVKAIFGNTTTSVAYKDVDEGLFLNHGNGIKTGIEATFGTGIDGNFALTDGTSVYKLR